MWKFPQTILVKSVEFSQKHMFHEAIRSHSLAIVRHAKGSEMLRVTPNGPQETDGIRAMCDVFLRESERAEENCLGCYSYGEQQWMICRALKKIYSRDKILQGMILRGRAEFSDTGFNECEFLL